MRTKVVVSFNTRDHPWREVRKIFSEAGCEQLLRAGPAVFNYYVATFWKEDQRLARLRELLSRANISWLERMEHVFTGSELESAPLLWLIVRTAPRGFGGPTYSTEYDLSDACPRCGSGARQVSPLRLRASEIPQRGQIFQTLSGELLVSPALGSTLEEAEISGLELRETQAAGSLTPLPWLQVFPQLELPRMAPVSKGILRDNPCPECDRDGHFHSGFQPVEIFYDARTVEVEALPDIVHTYERFGNSVLRQPRSDSNFGPPLVLAKPKFFQVFRSNRVRGVQFLPVRLHGDEHPVA